MGLSVAPELDSKETSARVPEVDARAKVDAERLEAAAKAEEEAMMAEARAAEEAEAEADLTTATAAKAVAEAAASRQAFLAEVEAARAAEERAAEAEREARKARAERNAEAAQKEEEAAAAAMAAGSATRAAREAAALEAAVASNSPMRLRTCEETHPLTAEFTGPDDRYRSMGAGRVASTGTLETVRLEREIEARALASGSRPGSAGLGGQPPPPSWLPTRALTGGEGDLNG